MLRVKFVLAKNLRALFTFLINMKLITAMGLPWYVHRSFRQRYDVKAEE